MTSKRSLTVQTRILSAFIPFLAALPVLIAFAAPAPLASTARPLAKSSAAPVPTRAGAQTALPTAHAVDQAERVAVSRPQTKLDDARGMTQDNFFSLLPVVTFDSGGYQANSVVVADVNRDGKLDLVVVNCGSCYGPPDITHPGSVVVMLGNGDGTFQAAVSYSSGGPLPLSVVVADVNRDARLDLLVINECKQNSIDCSTVGVLLGTGDGTFQPAVTYASSGYFSVKLAVADVNADGHPDLLVANECVDANCTGGSAGVLLGNGDGTFQGVVTYPSGGLYASAVTVADIDGDGKPDLLVANLFDSSFRNGLVGLLMGNGDGTFKPVVTYPSGGYGAGLVLTVDVNGDGKPDLLVLNTYVSTYGPSTVGVLLGNGDGTFQPAVAYDSGGGGYSSSAALEDLDRDGKPDLVVIDDCPALNCINQGTVDVLLGNGDGTFQPAVTFGAGGFLTSSVALADVNSDGKLDVLIANLCADNTDVCALASVGVLLNDTITTSPTSTTLTSSLNPSIHGQPITFTATVTTSGPIAPTGTVNFKWGPDGIGQGTLNTSGVATFTTSSLKPAPYKITAVYKGDASNLASTSAVLHQGVKRK
jgi:hypothetical protein